MIRLAQYILAKNLPKNEKDLAMKCRQKYLERKGGKK
jgi:hypothetical protein